MYAMVGKMAKMYPMLIMAGVVIVVISFIIGLNNSSNASDYFAQSKVVRETAPEWIEVRQGIESTLLWMPPLKFLGIGLILGGIVMALRIILDNLRQVGVDALPSERHNMIPAPPGFWPLLPMTMMLGWVIFVIALIVGLGLASDAREVFANPLPLVDAGFDADGNSLIPTIQNIHSTEAWLVPFKFLGIATEFLSIMIGLYTIIWVLNRQTEILDTALAEDAA